MFVTIPSALLDALIEAAEIRRRQWDMRAEGRTEDAFTELYESSPTEARGMEENLAHTVEQARTASAAPPGAGYHARLTENIAAIAAEVHKHPGYAKFYETNGESFDGFPGLWRLCAQAGEILTKEEADRVPYEYIDVIDKIAAAIVATDFRHVGAEGELCRIVCEALGPEAPAEPGYFLVGSDAYWFLLSRGPRGRSQPPAPFFSAPLIPKGTEPLMYQAREVDGRLVVDTPIGQVRINVCDHDAVFAEVDGAVINGVPFRTCQTSLEPKGPGWEARWSSVYLSRADGRECSRAARRKAVDMIEQVVNAVVTQYHRLSGKRDSLARQIESRWDDWVTAQGVVSKLAEQIEALTNEMDSVNAQIAAHNFQRVLDPGHK